jgi:DNA-damage-inducible protein J
MATTTTMVHVRVDEQIKAQATETLAAMGLSVSDAVRVFLMRVVAEQQLPFALKVPNAETRAAMAEANAIARTRRARFGTATELFDELEKKRRK